MDRPQSPPRRQRACQPCSKAKARCNFEPSRADQHTCDRCEKMGIVCAAKTSKSLRKPRQIKPLNSRVSSLEKRLETLVSTLEDRTAKPSQSSTSTTPPGPALAFRTPESVPTPGHEPRDDSLQHASSQHASSQQKQTEPQRPIQPQSTHPSSPPLGLTWPQAERILCIFREKFMYNFPFVIVQDDVSAQKLLQEKPFLFRAIMLVAAPLPTGRVKKMKRNVLAYLGTHLLVEEDRDLELFQGLLVCIAWADFKNLYDQQITTLTYLALGFAHNIAITKIPTQVLQQMGMDDAPDDLRKSKAAEVENPHTLDEQRAFLGCFCLIAANSTQFGRPNPLSNSRYVGICCDSLNWTRDAPSDFLLERAISMLQMGEKISDTFGAPNDQERSKPYLFLVEGNARGFRTELDGIMESLGQEQIHYESVYGPLGSSADFEDRKKSFTLYYHYLLVRLYEPATYLPEASHEGGAPSMYRSMSLRNCLLASKAYFDTFFEMSSSQYIYHSISVLQQTTFVMIITTRLLLIDAPDWDAELARLTLDFEDVMTRMVARVTEAEQERINSVRRFAKEMDVAGVTEEEIKQEGRLHETAQKTMWIRDWFARKIKGDVEGQEVVDDDMGITDFLANWPATQDWGGGNHNMTEAPWYGGLLGNHAWNFDDVNM